MGSFDAKEFVSKINNIEKQSSRRYKIRLGANPIKEIVLKGLD